MIAATELQSKCESTAEEGDHHGSEHSQGQRAREIELAGPALTLGKKNDVHASLTNRIMSPAGRRPSGRDDERRLRAALLCLYLPAMLATPLSWLLALDRWLCVPAFRRVCSSSFRQYAEEDEPKQARETPNEE
jgi:hypothetical protein